MSHLQQSDIYSHSYINAITTHDLLVVRLILVQQRSQWEHQHQQHQRLN